MHAVLKHHHPVIGVDWHIPWPPGLPAPAPVPVPYVTFTTMLGFVLVSSYAPTAFTQYCGMTMKRGTDVGFLIPHFGAPSLLTPLDMIFSSSKSYFGPSNVKAEGAPVAAALFIVLNPNLACGSPIPTPTGCVIAVTTHFVKMSFADICYGLLAGAIDFIIQLVIGKLIDWGSGKIAQWIAPKIMSGAAVKAMLRDGPIDNAIINVAKKEYLALANARAAKILDLLPFLDISPQSVNPLLEVTLATITGIFTGGPMGADADTIADLMFGREQPITPVGKLTGAIQSRVEEVFMPSSPSGGSPTPAPAIAQPTQQYFYQSGIENVGCTPR